MNITLTRILLALALLAAILFGAWRWYEGVVNDAYTRGELAERKVWQDKEERRVAAEARAAFHAAENNLRVQQDNEAKARKVSSDHQQELAAVRSYQSSTFGLRLPRALCNGAPAGAEGAGASGFDGANPGTAVFPEAVGRAFDRFAERARQLQREADAVAAIARGHQRFARANGLYGADDPEPDH